MPRKSLDASAPTDLVAVGRALEAGDIEKARNLIKGAPETPEAHLLLARIAMARGDYEEAVRRYHGLTDVADGFETKRVMALADALGGAGRHREAADQLRTLLDSKNNVSKKSRVRMMEKRASWLMKAGEGGEALKAYKEALEVTNSELTQDRINLALGLAQLASGDLKPAEKILAPLALKARRAGIMARALRALKRKGLAPSWSVDERMKRAHTLVQRRAWDAAMATIRPLFKKKKKAVVEEARWLEAQILFKRRRHYEQAIRALEPIKKGGGTYADEAALLIARALSRLDRDPEAITAYRAFAAKSKMPGKAAEARFLAARLEFYLGRHRAAVRSLEKLVGKGKKRKKGSLGPGRRRDAHFLAGMSALLAGWPRRAEPHFRAASNGTNNAEVLARNRYWTAVSGTIAKKKGGPDALRAICADDATSWYARLSARRLEDLEQDPGPCRIPKLSPAAGSPSAKPMEALSTLAAFLARAGLYKEAAGELRRVEKAGSVKATNVDWIENYIVLDAPQFAVRRASAGLEWPPEPDERWRAEAAYPSPYSDLVQEVQKKHGLPSGLLFAIARKESMFNPNAVSSVGAMGLMQMMPHTYEKNRKRAGQPVLEEGELPGPERSIRAAGFEFAELFERFDGSIPLAIMAYNGGPAAVSRWLDRSGDLPTDVFAEKAGFAQTRNYVKRVMRNLVRYRLLAGEPLPELPRIISRKKTNEADGGPKSGQKPPTQATSE
ncbi:MAG: transglycosylase SLT domain-containing protein [Deltaproteobacteria bacterium]|nr:transglycosylase SLT domain-containing protein [Deltaproteobacteria bacterium]